LSKIQKLAVLCSLILSLILLSACYVYDEMPNPDSNQAQTELAPNDTPDTEIDDKHIRFVFTRVLEDPVAQWYEQVYEEAFMRLGYTFEMEHAPPERASTFTSDGIYDGEALRIYDYGDTHPNLIRVDEPLVQINFSAFSVNKDIKLTHWESVIESNYKVAYRLGTAKLEYKLVDNLTANRLIKSYNNKGAIDHLMEHSADIYIDVESYVYAYLKTESFEEQGYDQVIYNLGPIESVTGHAFLYKKHEALAPLLSNELKQMKSEGLMKAYFDELGLTPSDLNLHE